MNDYNHLTRRHNCTLEAVKRNGVSKKKSLLPPDKHLSTVSHEFCWAEMTIETYYFFETQVHNESKIWQGCKIDLDK